MTLKRLQNHYDTIIVCLPHHTSIICGSWFWQTHWHYRWVECECDIQFDQGNVIVVVYIVGVVVLRVNMDWGSKQRRFLEGFYLIKSHENLQVNIIKGKTYQGNPNQTEIIQSNAHSQLLTRRVSFATITPSFTTLWAAVIIHRSPITMPPPLFPLTLSSTCQGIVLSGASWPPKILWYTLMWFVGWPQTELDTNLHINLTHQFPIKLTIWSSSSFAGWKCIPGKQSGLSITSWVDLHFLSASHVKLTEEQKKKQCDFYIFFFCWSSRVSVLPLVEEM